MTEGVQAAGGLDHAEYDRLLRSTATDRQEIVLRLAAEAGLRPAEIARLTQEDVEAREHDGVTHFLVSLGDGDAGRLAYLPADLEVGLRSYVSTTGATPSEPIFGVSPRRIQMIVSEVSDRAATEHDVPALESVSTRELRRYHARTLLGRGIDPRIVRGITAWNRLDTLTPSLGPPDPETILVSLAGGDRREGIGPGAGAGGGRSGAGDDRSGRLVDLVEHVVRLGEVLSRASTREAIERGACQTLASFYEYAWIVSEVGNDVLEFRERTTDGAAGEFDQASEPPGTVCQEVYESGEPVVVARETDGGEAATRAVVPVLHADNTYGVLEVGVPSEPGHVGGRERRVLRDVGRRLGQAIAAVERRRLLLADTVLRLSFSCTDDRAVFVRLSDTFDCSFTLTGLVPGESGSLLAFVWLEGVSPDDVFQQATEIEAVESARLIRSSDDGSLLEFVLTADSPALTLVECGGSLTELTASKGRGTITAEFVPDVDVREVVGSVEAAFPDSEMVTKREVERSVRTDTEFREALEDTLTGKQRSALRAAYLSGYFDWPRGSTAEELADSLGVSSPTFHSHLRRAQQKILTTFLEDGEP